MQSPAFKFLVIAAFFFATWYVLYQVDWVERFEVEKTGKKTERKLGEMMMEVLTTGDDEIGRKSLTDPLDDIINAICAANFIDRESIKPHLIHKADVNAFALPDDHMVIFSGLITSAKNEAEVAGVICHELAHMTQNHVMKKLVKEIGLSVLISMTTGGNAGGELIKEALRTLSSSAYDRSLESEADLIAVDYMLEAGFDPEGLANFLFRLAESTESIPEEFYWISSHPESEERALSIIEYIGEKNYEVESVLSEQEWDDYVASLKNY